MFIQNNNVGPAPALGIAARQGSDFCGAKRSKKLNGKKVRGLGIALFYNAKARP
jgi:hypothetical protein